MKTNFAAIFAENRANIMKMNTQDKTEILTLKEQAVLIDKTDLNEIKGVGQATVKALLENGISTKEQLSEKTMEDIRKFISNPISLVAIEKFLTKQ